MPRPTHPARFPMRTGRRSIRMTQHSTPADRNERRIADWQLALLRFAVTRAPLDRAVAVATAMELDAAAGPCTSSFRFFVRHTDEICDAVAAAADERSLSTLRRFAMRINDVRLRAAFSAAVGLQDCFAPRSRSRGPGARPAGSLERSFETLAGMCSFAAPPRRISAVSFGTQFCANVRAPINVPLGPPYAAAMKISSRSSRI